jgi:hypothetical protein
MFRKGLGANVDIFHLLAGELKQVSISLSLSFYVFKHGDNNVYFRGRNDPSLVCTYE